MQIACGWKLCTGSFTARSTCAQAAELVADLVVNNRPAKQGVVLAKGSFVRHGKDEAGIRPHCKVGLHCSLVLS